MKHPDCTVVMQSRQDPTALNAQSLDVAVTIRCNGFSTNHIEGQLNLTDENERYRVDYDFVAPGYPPASGPFLHVNETPVKRHVYVADLSLLFLGTFTNARPPECGIATKSDVGCSFQQTIVGLTTHPALVGPPSPTPTWMAVGDCGVYITIERSAPAGLTAHLTQGNCLGMGVLSIYADRAEGTQLAHADVPCSAPPGFGCTAPNPTVVDASIPVALPGHVYTITFYEDFLGMAGFVPPGCRSYILYSGSGQRCEQTVNALVAG